MVFFKQKNVIFVAEDLLSIDDLDDKEWVNA